jgi:hypothetical protein
MPYLVNIQDDPRYENWDFKWTLGRYEQYRAYLATVADRLPPRAYEFATAGWHYNSEDSRKLHDSVAQEVTMRSYWAYMGRPRFRYRQRLYKSRVRKSLLDRYIGRTGRDPILDIHVRLLGAYLDGHMELLYKRVHSLQMSSPHFPYPLGLVDLLVDEMELSEQSFLVHRIRFDVDVMWVIECEGFDYRWKPFKEEPSVVLPDGSMRW